jgi:hypothetical protein
MCYIYLLAFSSIYQLIWLAVLRLATIPEIDSIITSTGVLVRGWDTVLNVSKSFQSIGAHLLDEITSNCRMEWAQQAQLQ